LNRLYIYIFFFLPLFLFAQKKKYVLVDIQSQKKVVKKDSLSAVKFLDSLAENNYYFTQIKTVESQKDSTKIFFDKGLNYNQAFVSLPNSLAQKFKLKNQFFTKNLDSLRNVMVKKMVEEGYSFSRIKTKYLGMNQQQPKVELSFILGNQRIINGFVLKGYEKVPKRFVKNLEKEYNGKIYDARNLKEIQRSLQNHSFVTLERPPQTLFTKDSTKVFLFLQKKKASTFDGMIGFGNDDKQKFALNGSINVNFKNLLNGFETVNIFWQRTPDKGQTFNLQTDVPYVAKSNLGLNVNLNIFRQDSTYAVVKFQPAVYYHINNRQRLGLRGTFENSVVLDSLQINGNDYNKTGFGLWYEFTKPSENPLFLYQSKIRLEADLLSTNYTSKNANAHQMHYYLFAEHNQPIAGNHWVNLKAESSMLNSNQELSTNELLRFGGWNSLRGFNENSLYADFYYYANAEYRYITGEKAFFDTFLQYGQLRNKTLQVSPKFYSFGLGFNFFLPIGLMSFQISNGNEFGNPIKFNETKIHWGILSRF